MEKVTVNASTSYEIIIDKGILDSAGDLISQVIKKGKALVVTDDNADRFYGGRVMKSLSDAGIEDRKSVV